jgi:glucose/arabinose dehydrogenase
VGGLKATQLQRLVLKDGAVGAAEILLKDQGDRIRDVRQGPDGALWVLTDDQDGKLLRLSPG